MYLRLAINTQNSLRRFFSSLLLALAFLPAACSLNAGTDSSSFDPPGPPPTTESTLASPIAAEINSQRSPTVPDLPFPDNPDPSQCGIPVPWGENGQAWLTGMYEGDLVQPVVLLYDSHLRLNITARAPHGSEVDILLFQGNPTLDYYLVKIVGVEGEGSEGWVPAPFLSFEPVEER